MRIKYPEIELLLNDGAPRVEDRLFRLVSILIGEDKWRYALIWGGIYFYQLDLPLISPFIAENTLSHLINLSTTVRDPVPTIDQLSQSMDYKNTGELDQCLIALTFMFLTVDNSHYVEAVSKITKLFSREIILAHRSSLDGLSSAHYYMLLEHLVAQYKGDFIEFRKMIQVLLSYLPALIKTGTNINNIAITIQDMLGEVKNRLEKPDRNLLSFNNYILVSDYAKAWFDTDKSNNNKRFPKHYFASDLRSQQLGTINSFWITAATGLYFLRESLKEGE